MKPVLIEAQEPVVIHIVLLEELLNMVDLPDTSMLCHTYIIYHTYVYMYMDLNTCVITVLLLRYFVRRLQYGPAASMMHRHRLTALHILKHT